MRTEPEKLIARYRSKGVLIDTNLLLLFYIGTLDRQLIPRFKRTNAFTQEDYDKLSRLLAFFNKRVVTPNVLTEVSNLAGELEGKYRQEVFTKICEVFDLLHEEYVPSQVAVRRVEFIKFGLTDAALMAMVERKILLLTSDFPLANFCESTGSDVINWHHIRFMNW